MRRWADKKGGYAAEPDGFDRSDAGTLASRADAWLAWLENRAYSASTLSARRWALRTFLSWAQERELIRPEMITRPVLESYQRWLWRREKADGRPLGVRTQRSFLAALQGLFAWLCRQNLLPSNPAADLELPRKPRQALPKALSAAEVAAVLAVPDVSDPLGVRDRALLEILYSTGLRRTELVRLDLSDVDRAHGTLWVRQGKGGKDRVVPLGEVALHWTERYLAECRPRLETGGPRQELALFLTGYGERFHPGYVGNWVKRTMQAAGIERTGSCHLFRHSCATHMLENGADIRFIQQLLGHARLDTTQIYTEVTIHQLREVHARTHPHGRRPAAAPKPPGLNPAAERP